MAARAEAAPKRASRNRTDVGRPVEVLAWVAGILLGLPILVLVVRSVLDGSLLAALGMGVVADALILSLVTTAISLVVMVVFGTPLALVLARRRFRGHVLLETVIDLPIVLPPSVAWLALLLVFGRRWLLGSTLDVFCI